ncbi:MAG TPA: hypothetical protein VGX78_10190, partial [Pirellulales bacterium]|nr:hypothetical protein [Pirellulales bacterium]
MKTRTYLVLSLLAVLAGGGCDDAAPNRRNASGAIGGAGLVAPDAAVSPSSQAPKQQPVAVPVSPNGVASPGAPVSPGGATAPAGQALASAPP